MQMEAACEADSHVNYHFLDTQQKLLWLRSMHTVIRKQQNQIKSLKDKIERQFQSSGIKVDDEANDGLIEYV